MSVLEKINKDINNEFNTAVILAGGKSSRMGFDKQFLEINQKRLLDTIIEQLKLEFDEIIIVTNKLENYANFKYKVVCDEIHEKGPLGGIHIGLKESRSKYTYFLACDMPNINLDYIRFMKSNIKNKDVDACVTKDLEGNIEPFNGFYNKSIVGKVEKNLLEGKQALMYLIRNIETLYIDESKTKKYINDMFLNLNTKDDLNKYIETLKNV